MAISFASSENTTVPEGTFDETTRLLPQILRGKDQNDEEVARRSGWGWIAPWISPLILLLVWFLVSRANWISPQILVPPSGVASAFWSMVESGDLWSNLSHSLYRLAVGYGIGVALGLLLGTSMALSRAIQAYLYPSFQILRQLPTISLIPAFIMFLGIGETIKIVLVAKATALPVALAAFEAVRGIPRSYLDVAHVLKVRPLPLFFQIVLPATVPPVLTGMRIALGRSWMVLVAAELLVSQNGLGQLMEYGREMFQLDTVMVCVVLTGIIGFVFDKGFRLLESRLARWEHL
jgi:sulfonate transport system permease protein